MRCHLCLGATPSVQAIGHQMGTFLIHLYSKLQCYHLPAWLGAVALTVLFGELSCHKSQVLPGCAKLSESITATAARWPSMAPYRGASGLAIRVYSIPWPPASPGALPTPCTIEGAPLLAFELNATILDAPGSAEVCIGIALKKRWFHGNGLWKLINTQPSVLSNMHRFGKRSEGGQLPR